MTPSQQTIQKIRDAITQGTLEDAERALEEYCLVDRKNFFGWFSTYFHGVQDGNAMVNIKYLDFDKSNAEYQLFNQINIK